MTDRWPFDEPANLGVLSVRQIFEAGKPILLVSHDEDGDWQFLDGSDNPRVEDGVLVCLGHVLERDPSVADVHDLPMGWLAWRSAVGASWQREPNPRTDDEDSDDES
jgi:hypothetical protein